MAAPFVLMSAGLLGLAYELRARMERFGVVGVALTLAGLIGILVGSSIEMTDPSAAAAPAGRSLWLLSFAPLGVGGALLGLAVTRIRELPDARGTGAFLMAAVPTGLLLAFFTAPLGALAVACLFAPYGLAYALFGARWLEVRPATPPTGINALAGSR